jgi:hypothetical protein
MRPYLLLLPLLTLSTPAEAGVGALLRLVAGAGKVASKGAGAAKVVGKAGTVGRVAATTSKVGSLAIGARVLTLADDPSRVAVFVAREGDDVLRVVYAGGDDAVHSAAGVRQTVGELDAMAAVADDAGVDVFLHPNALDTLTDLPVGPNTRVFVADGASAPRAVRAAPGATVSIDGGHGALRVGVDVAQQAIGWLGLPVDSPEVVHLDDSCGTSTATLDAALAGQGTVVLIAARGRSPNVPDTDLADLVIFELDAVCDADGELVPAAAATTERARAATDVGALWTAGGGEVELTLLPTEGAVTVAAVAPTWALHAQHQRQAAASLDPRILQIVLALLGLLVVAVGVRWTVERRRARALT